MTAPAPLSAGRVVDYDQAVGLGTVEDANGRRYGFHCTQIAGGSRTIEVGTAVSFAVVPARLGTWEAAAVTPVAGATAVTAITAVTAAGTV